MTNNYIKHLFLVSFQILILLPLISLTSATASTLEGRVVEIQDGDTITILSSENIQTKIRLYGIDCPEKSQDFGNKAKQYTTKLVAMKKVKVSSYDIDKCGRTVGVVLVDGININEQILKAGLAWQYRKYCKEAFCSQWLNIETDARNAGLGLWQENSPVPPWVWRKRN